MTNAKKPKVQQKKLRGPKGTRDFYPELMAWRRYIVDAWRSVSLRHGFDEIEGPTFESLDLYTIKSGEGIVNELFSFQDRGGRDLALRPEFTPTLARMVVARANSLPKPIKWFSIPLHYRAERPQRGRLREFIQWNVDMIGDYCAFADVEVLGVAIDLMAELGLTREIVRVKISHRQTMSKCLVRLGVPEKRLPEAFTLLDKRDKIDQAEFQKQAGNLGLDQDTVARFDEIAQTGISANVSWGEVIKHLNVPEEDLVDLYDLHSALNQAGIAAWCEYDLGIVRGLAYYTGMVFEVRDTAGKERAVCGGGRYDKLIETFGGPALPACGFGMGDVVLSMILEDHKLKPDDETLMPGAEVFLISAGSEKAELAMPGLLQDLRRSGIHARRSYKTTRNIGKLLKEASSVNATFAVILGDELEQDEEVVVKNMEDGYQFQVGTSQLAENILVRLGRFSKRGLD